MKAFGKTVGKTVVFCLVMMLMCSFVYPLALTKQGEKNKEAVQFEQFVKHSTQAKTVFQKYGFSVKP